MHLTINDYTPECIYLVAQKQSTRLYLQFVCKSLRKRTCTKLSKRKKKPL